MQNSIFPAIKPNSLGYAADWYGKTIVVFVIITCPKLGSLNSTGQYIAKQIAAVLLYGKFLIRKMAQFGTRLLLSSAGLTQRVRWSLFVEPSGSTGLSTDYDGSKMSKQIHFHLLHTNLLGKAPYLYKTLVHRPFAAKCAANNE